MPILKNKSKKSDYSQQRYSPQKGYADPSNYDVESMINRDIMRRDEKEFVDATTERERVNRLRGTENINRGQTKDNFSTIGDTHAEKLRNAIKPFSYNINPTRISRIMDRYDDPENKPENWSLAMKDHPKNRPRYDAFSLYLGQPQRNDTFTVSKHRPASGYEQYPETYTFKDPKQLNKYLQSATHYGLLDDLRSGKINKNSSLRDRQRLITDTENRVMGTNTLGIGWNDKDEPYLSVADEWDLAQAEGIPGNPGKPFMLYDRIPLSKEMIETLSSDKNIGRFKPRVLNSGPKGMLPDWMQEDKNPMLSEELPKRNFGFSAGSAYYREELGDKILDIQKRNRRPEKPITRKKSLLYKSEAKDRPNYVENIR